MKNLNHILRKGKYLGLKLMASALSKGEVVEVLEKDLTEEIINAFRWLEELKIAEQRFDEEEKVHALIPIDYQKMNSFLEEYSREEILNSYDNFLKDKDGGFLDFISAILERNY